VKDCAERPYTEYEIFTIEEGEEMKLVVVVLYIIGMGSSAGYIVMSDVPLHHVATLGWCISSFLWTLSYYKYRRINEGK
jgi:hypothetical protein